MTRARAPRQVERDPDSGVLFTHFRCMPLKSCQSYIWIIRLGRLLFILTPILSHFSFRPLRLHMLPDLELIIEIVFMCFMVALYLSEAKEIIEHDTGLLTQGVLGGPTGPLRTPSRTPWTLRRMIGTVP